MTAMAGTGNSPWAPSTAFGDAATAPLASLGVLPGWSNQAGSCRLNPLRDNGKSCLVSYVRTAGTSSRLLGF